MGGRGWGWSNDPLGFLFVTVNSLDIKGLINSMFQFMTRPTRLCFETAKNKEAKIAASF